MRWMFMLGGMMLAACSESAVEEPVSTLSTAEPLNSITLMWTLSERADETACTDARAALLDVSVIRSETGEEVTKLQQPCATFVTSVSLAPGSYVVRARLLDMSGAPRTPEMQLAPFTVDERALVQEVQFTSFL